MTIILIGFMGSGKTTLAKQLGPMLNMPVLEMDRLVLEKTGKPNMQTLFADSGELLLRETEIAIAKQYAGVSDTIVSTGGGVVLNKIVLDYLKGKHGITFFLNAPFHLLAKRVTEYTNRPLFQNIVEAESLYHFRQPLYLKYADHVLDVENKSIEEVAHEISYRRSRNGK